MESAFTSGKKLTALKVEKACSALTLQLTMKGSLKSLPDNVHWHYKLAKQPGVLEISFILSENKLSISCKKNRAGEWINEAVEALKRPLNLNEIS